MNLHILTLLASLVLTGEGDISKTTRSQDFLRSLSKKKNPKDENFFGILNHNKNVTNKRRALWRHQLRG